MSQFSRNPITVYTDAAFNPELKHGSWAFFVPLYSFESAHSTHGADAGQFELLAALQAVRWVIKNHGTPSPIQIRTDCHAVIFWLAEVERSISAGRVRPIRVVPEQFVPVLAEFQTIMRKRPITTAKVTSRGDKAHMRCHHIANEQLRIKIAETPELRQALAEKTPDNDLRRLLRARTALKDRINRLDDEIWRTHGVRPFGIRSKYFRWRHWRWVIFYSWRKR